MLRVFVYGTLKPGESNYPYYCQGKVTGVVQAHTRGKLYHLSHFGYPAMVPGHEIVQGYLLTFPNPGALTSLDQLEDYDPGNPKPHGYQRLRVPVYDSEGHNLGDAWAYFMTENQVNNLGGIWQGSGIWGGEEFTPPP